MAASLSNGLHLKTHPPEPSSLFERFCDIPQAIDIPVAEGEADEAVEVDLQELLDDPSELCQLLQNENAAKSYWITIALAYAKQDRIDDAVEIVKRGLEALNSGNSEDKLGLYTFLCWLYLLRSRGASRVKLDKTPAVSSTLKDQYLTLATTALNDASRLNPSYIPLLLARGVVGVLRAALVQSPMEKAETLRQALKTFEEALRSSGGRNLMAMIGRAKTLFSLGKYGDALHTYQQALELAPNFTDPDPRIGIGCCLWQLGHKEAARVAWERAIELQPESKVALALVGLSYLYESSQLATTDPNFAALYKKAMVQYTQKAFKLDNDFPLACAAFGSYFLLRKAMPTVETLARKAIELTDINAVASDGWYLLARKEHYADELGKANDFYMRADQARGGDERGYLPAKFGMAQIKVLQQDADGAKFRLEKIAQQTKNIEAMTLLGSLFATDVFSDQDTITKDEKANAGRRAISYLEHVRTAWKDTKRHLLPDSSVLLTLARLYETDSPDKSLQCLQQVEQMELDDLPDDIRPANVDDQSEVVATLREYLSPQLLNNIACFHFQAEKLSSARELFQAALNACVRIGDSKEGVDADALVTTISYNLGRTLEAENLLDEAKKVYQGLLDRHGDYTDARIRLVYIELRQSPVDEGPKVMAALYESESTNLDVRSLYGWYLRRSKRKVADLAQDQEQRHFKHTLQNHDKHDRYSLTAMGNLYLTTAREMRRDTDQEKERRRKMYERAVEFFDKALQLDPRNAYAAQGIAIAMIEDKRELQTALQILLGIRETIKDASVSINLGHVFCELKQYPKAIESYEAALAKERARDPQILACLGRVWLLRGKQERSVTAMKTSLEYSQRALQVAPDQVHFRFNVAFVQIQIAQTLYSLPETQRSLEDVESAAVGLDAAIESFSAIAKSPNPPFPRNDIEQRANMGRNTIRKQLERAIQSQREYEAKNATRLKQAREQREAEQREREEELRRAEEEFEAKRKRIAEERQKMQEQDRLLAEQRAAEEQRRAEEELDERDMGEDGEKKRKKKGQGKRRKAEDAIESEGDDDSAPIPSDGERPRRKKKRRLDRTGKNRPQPLSEEFVRDSDEDDLPPLDDQEDDEALETSLANGDGAATSGVDSAVDDDTGGGEEVPITKPASTRRKRMIVEDEDDEDDAVPKMLVPESALNGSNGAMNEDED